MRRLNNRAYNILAKEVNRLVQDPLESVRRDIILRRLDKFRLQTGQPLTYVELKAEIEDIFPEFNDTILKRAARANRGAGKLILVRNGVIGATVVAGSVWALNLPYPMIRWPVSKVAPIVLLPSFMSMDHSYRQAISLVEQADQLVNQATSGQDIELGATRVQAAQRHLDNLPVWFLGYYPQTYCTWFSCTWRFTYDEFEAARRAIGRMEAKVFQEENALKLLEQGTEAVDAAKQQYQSATAMPAKIEAVTAWQAGIDMLNEIPSETLAGRMGQTKLEAYRRDFSQVSGILADGSRSSNLIEAARQFAWTASEEAQNPPHREETWQRIADLWQQAINRLEQVPVDNAGYAEAQRMLAEYQNKLGVVEERLSAEQRSRQAFESAQSQAVDLGARVETLDTVRYASALQGIINALNQVQPGTTAHEPAQQLLQAVQARLRETSAAAQ